LELAEMALSIAERVPGEERWRSRLRSYCWAHVGNARRVANDLSGSEVAFSQAWALWRDGNESDPELLGDWVLPSMQASLRAVQRRFSEALELLDQARASQGGSSPASLLTLLFQREYVCEQMGDYQGALATLAEAASLVKDSGDPRQRLAFHFKRANNFYHLQRYEEAMEPLLRAQDLAVQQGNELDLIRVVWLTARVAAGQGRTEEALAGLEQVRRDLSARELACDAALASLDLAILLLDAGRTVEVKDLAVAIGWIFQTKGIGREALAALKLFYDAARHEAATVELAKQVRRDIAQAKCSAPSVGSRRDRV
jgi:tetratricopeptide (TPR) repeat protein